jgi:hypothetical protein
MGYRIDNAVVLSVFFVHIAALPPPALQITFSYKTLGIDLFLKHPFWH